MTSDQENNVLTAALSKESAAYNFESVKLLGEQKLNALANISKFGSGYMIDILSNAEYLTPNTSMKYACSELIVFAFNEINIKMSQANGFTPGNMIRLSQAGFFKFVGKLQVSRAQ